MLCSSSYQPAPIPSPTRPDGMWSPVATFFAGTDAGRNGTGDTPGPGHGAGASSRTRRPQRPENSELGKVTPMSAEIDSPLKTRDDEIQSDGTLSADRGWHDMDVKWLITRANMGSRKTVVGRT